MTLWRPGSLIRAPRRLRRADEKAALGPGRLLRGIVAFTAMIRGGLSTMFTRAWPFDPGQARRGWMGRWLQLGGWDARGRAHDWSTITVATRVLNAGQPPTRQVIWRRAVGRAGLLDGTSRTGVAALRRSAGPPGAATAPC